MSLSIQFRRAGKGGGAFLAGIFGNSFAGLPLLAAFCRLGKGGGVPIGG